MRFFHSLKVKLIIMCTIASILSSFLLCWQIYRVMSSSLEKEQLQTVNYNLSLITSNVERELDTLYQVVLFCSTNKEISRFTSGMKNSSYSSYPVSLTAYEHLNSKIFNSSIDRYISKLILCSKTGEVIIQGQTSGMSTDADVCRQLPYFETLLEAPDYEWIGLFPEPFFNSNPHADSLPVIRPLINKDSGSIDGWLYIALSPEIITNKLMTPPQTFDSAYYWIIGEKAYRFENGTFLETTLNIEDTGKATLTVTENDISMRALSSSVANASWTLLQTLPETNDLFASGEFEKLVIPYILSLVSIFLILDFILVKMVSRPVSKLCGQLDVIAGGTFSTDPSLETEDEFGYIGREINMMSHNISQLMQQQLETEQEKRQLELDNLQNQISPHFLYNTLITIKWMAILQNAPGITEMLESLTQIMKHLSKNVQSKIPLRDELALLSHYITIQSYRYSDSFTYTQTIEDESLLDCQVFKFSLQPLIENAIFHGVGNSKRPGEILLHVSAEGNDLLIRITDNGMGITAQQIDQILSPNENITEKETFQKIGLNNINRRLKLEYGENYGICIRSQVGSYTEVTVRYPLIRQTE